MRNSILFHKQEEHNIWQSYSDLMAAFIMVLLLLVTVAVIQLNFASNAARNAENEAESLKASAEKLQRDAEIAESKAESLKAEAEAKGEKYDNVKADLDEIIEIRAAIMQDLEKEFENSTYKFKIDEAGSIIFEDSIFFDKNQSILKTKGEELLSDFLPRYLKVVLGSKYIDSVSEIIIEGHTDSEGGKKYVDGPYLYNLNLSQERALSVAAFCLKEVELSDEMYDNLKGLLTANGKSYSQPILNEDGSENMDASRRVVIRFRLTEEKMMEQIEEILDAMD